MPRTKSVVLSKDEKKALVTDLKSKVKDAKAHASGITKARKTLDKDYTGAVKANDKAAATAAKELAALEKQLTAVSA